MFAFLSVSPVTGIRMADSGPGESSGQGMAAPGGSGRGSVVGRRIPSSISPGRLPTMRSRDLTLGGVKKVMLIQKYVLSSKCY